MSSWFRDLDYDRLANLNMTFSSSIHPVKGEAKSVFAFRVHRTGHVRYTFIPEIATKNLAKVCGPKQLVRAEQVSEFRARSCQPRHDCARRTIEQRCNLLIGKLFVLAEEVGALCFSRGKQRFSVAGECSTVIMRFSAGLERSGAKAQSLAMKRFFRWTEVQLPPAEAGGASTITS
jgi:hypothetical protein